MHSVDQTTEQMVRSVLAYAENRLRMTPVPLDRGTRSAQELSFELDGLIRDNPRPPDEVLGVYSSVIAPSCLNRASRDASSPPPAIAAPIASLAPPATDVTTQSNFSP